MKDDHRTEDSFREQYEAGRAVLKTAAAGLLRGSLVFWADIVIGALILWGITLLWSEEALGGWMSLFTLLALWLVLAGLLMALAPFHARDKYAYMWRTKEQQRRQVGEDVRQMLTTSSLYWETGAFAVWTALFPVFSKRVVQGVFPGAQPGERLFLLGQVLLLILPCGLMGLASGVAARRRWFRGRDTYDWEQPEQRSVWWVIREVLLWVLNGVLFLFLLVVLLDVFSQTAGIVQAFGVRNVIVVLLVVVGVPTVIGWGRTLIARVRLMRRLRCICEAKGYTLVQRQNPYIRAFFPGRAPELVVETGEKRILCKLIASHRQRKKLMFQPGRYTFYHRLGLAAVWIPVRHRYDFGGEPGQSVLVLCPGRMEVSRAAVLSGGGMARVGIGTMQRWSAADNGDRVGDALLFEQEAFGNYLERLA